MSVLEESQKSLNGISQLNAALINQSYDASVGPGSANINNKNSQNINQSSSKLNLT